MICKSFSFHIHRGNGRQAHSEEILGCEYQSQMLSSRKDKKFQKQPKDGILGLETYPPGAISVIFLHTAVFSYWLLSIPFSLVLDLECMVFPGFVNCSSKVGNLRSCSPSLFADQQVQRIPDPPATGILKIPKSLGCQSGNALPSKTTQLLKSS